MNLRTTEYEQLGVSAHWLDPIKSRNAYDFAIKFTSADRYGLNDKTVQSIERHIVQSYTVADAWPRSRVPGSGTVQVVYSDTEVCVLEAADLLANWQGLFVPSRDDAVVLCNLHPTVFFYCHEEEFEVGQRDA